MDPILVGLILMGNLSVLGFSAYKFKKLKSNEDLTKVEAAKRERELIRRVLELQVLQSLGERVGYSLDLRKTLEVIIDSLKGLMPYSTVSYMILTPNSKIIFKTHVEQTVSPLFISEVKGLMFKAVSVILSKSIDSLVVDETLSGIPLDSAVTHPVKSFFNLPIIIGGQVMALINVSSNEKGLYQDDETTILYTIINQVSAHATRLFQVLEQEKRRILAMISSLTEGIMMVDPKFNLIVANPAAYSLLNLKPDASLDVIFQTLIKNCDLKTMIAKSITSLNREMLLPFEINNKAVQIEVEPVRDRMGYLLGSVVLLKDETAQKQLERLREDFTAMMVHELRTPLTTISYGIETVVSDLNNLSHDDLTHYLTVVKQATGDVLALVNDLLDVARIESGKFDVVKRQDDLAALIKDKVMMLKTLADQKHIDLNLQIDPNLTAVIFDRVRLGQALTNLISNSIKYTDKGGVKVLVGVQNNQIFVSVSDTGDGIDQEDLPKLFSKFRQLGRGKTGEKGGTGLGLVIVKGIIEAHGGKIWADSAGKGQGSTFTFTIPRYG